MKLRWILTEFELRFGHFKVRNVYQILGSSQISSFIILIESNFLTQNVGFILVVLSSMMIKVGATRIHSKSNFLKERKRGKKYVYNGLGRQYQCRPTAIAVRPLKFIKSDTNYNYLCVI